ncbi:MAG: EAL domain-containing protein, partial [Clostridia bacterium]|nr:EAL domain-containing protein [Clostridia bacterium]
MENKITESLVNGLENNEFKMYLQFIVDSKTQQIVSAEALSRW